MIRFALAVGLASSVLGTAYAAEVRNAAELLPETIGIYVEITDPAGLVDLLAEHPLRNKVEQTEEYRQATSTPKFLLFRLVLGSIEQRLGGEWRSALKGAFGEQIAIAVDAETGGVVVIARASDPAALDRLIDVLVRLSREDARKKDKPDPFEEDAYRDVEFYKTDAGAFAVHDGVFVATNNGKFGRLVIDRLLDGGGTVLAEQPKFQQARDESANSTGWFYANMERVRPAVGPMSPLATGRTDNPVAELLFGGLVDNLRNTPVVNGTVTLDSRQLLLSVSTPHRADWVSDGRTYFFGPDGSTAPPPIPVDQRLLTLTAFRDVSLMWLRAGELFNQKTVDDLANADSGLSTLFGGKDFGEDVLGALAPELQLVLARQVLDPKQPRPAVVLPSIALVGTLQDPETMRPDLRRTFLSLVGFLNVVGATEGRPQLDFEMTEIDQNQLIVTRYVVEKGQSFEAGAPIYFNFSPSMAFVGDQIILSSTEALAREMIASVQRPAEPTSPSHNTSLELEAAALKDLLADNREQLVTHNMLSKGHNREEAEREITALLTIIGLFKSANLSLDNANEELNLQFQLRWEE